MHSCACHMVHATTYAEDLPPAVSKGRLVADGARGHSLDKGPGTPPASYRRSAHRGLKRPSTRAYWCLGEKRSSGEEDAWGNRLSEHQLKGRRAVSAPGFQGEGSPKILCFPPYRDGHGARSNNWFRSVQGDDVSTVHICNMLVYSQIYIAQEAACLQFQLFSTAHISSWSIVWHHLRQEHRFSNLKTASR